MLKVTDKLLIGYPSIESLKVYKIIFKKIIYFNQVGTDFFAILINMCYFLRLVISYL